MSIEIVLLPLAVAAFAAWQAKAAADEQGRTVISVGTRMKNETLLHRSLVDTGASLARDGNILIASWGHTQGQFSRNDSGIWAVHFKGAIDTAQASDLVGQIDTAYGRHVQTEVLLRLREQASSVGMEVFSERTEDDDSVTMVLNLTRGA